MTTLPLSKFGFRIRTRSGAIVEKVLISGETEQKAQVKLNKMYPYCEVMSSWQEAGAAPVGVSSFEGLADLISR